MSEEYEIEGRTIYRKAFIYERPGSGPTTVPRVALFHLCDVIEDIDGVMMMLNTESHEIQELRAENKRLMEAMLDAADDCACEKSRDAEETLRTALASSPAPGRDWRLGLDRSKRFPRAG